MKNFILSFNVVVPLFINIMFGYFIKKLKLIDTHTLKVMNSVTFKTFLPLLLFYNVYKTRLDEAINAKFIIFALVSIFLVCILATIIILIIEKENKRRGVLIQAIFRSNFVLFGLPVITSLFGDESAGVTSMLIAIIVPIFNFLAVIVLEIFRGGEIDVKKIMQGIITNPLILSSVFGLILLFAGVKLPYFLEKSINDISKIATPLALIILGGSFEFDEIAHNIRQIAIGVFGKLIAVPIIFVPIAINVGFRNIELATLIIMLAAPTAVSSFTMAEQMEADGELAGQLVVFTSAISVFTIFIWIFIMKELGYI
ncbi:AEC family transporter [Clostridium sp. SM-530-WT-3G]|uniref:AEC family transporter n=1 Tax=Clostridium sp. SM-530-WT-3G TaxID=2725303 RepID=UPI00145E885E|nr:AEC family transporter [Clostridium sp. SM-530-WT-3G]NME84165.1 AEC family transporter [Clostridium sp. SM-530-WT-3G]